jgi:hypothetical protein
MPQSVKKGEKGREFIMVLSREDKQEIAHFVFELIQEIDREKLPYLMPTDSRNHIAISLGEDVSVNVSSLESLDKVRSLAEEMARSMKPNDSMADPQKAFYHGIG